MPLPNNRRLVAKRVRFAPAWVMSPEPGARKARVDIDLTNGRAWVYPSETTLDSVLACSRASPATSYYETSEGQLSSFAANALRIGSRGLLVEEARTNVILWCRDLTNAAWTKTNCTAALDQTGTDGTSNSASSITASAGNATCLQAITLASSARWTTAYVKRLTGSGVVQMTTDNGSTWTAVSVSASWARISIPTQTLANPTVGFRLVTSGDAIAVDFVQSEASSVQATSPIATTTASVTRAADVVSFRDASWLDVKALTLRAQGWGVTPTSGESAIYCASHSTGSALIFVRQGASFQTFFARPNTAVTSISSSIEANTAHAGRHNYVLALAENDFACCTDAGNITADTSGGMPDANRMHLGSQGGSSNFWNGYIQRFSVWDSRLSNAELQLLSAANTDFLVLFDGDSIPQSPSSSTSYAGYMRSTLAPVTWAVQNVAVSGSSIANSVAAADLTAAARLATLQGVFDRYRRANPALKSCTFISTGHNDKAVDSDSTSTFLSQVQSYFATLSAAGHRSASRHKLAICGVPPSTSPADFNAWRGTVNTTLLTYPSTHCDYVVDLSGVTGCADGDASNTAYWSDGIHPTAAHAITLAAAIKAQALDPAAA